MAETLLLEVKHLKKHFPIKGGCSPKRSGMSMLLMTSTLPWRKGKLSVSWGKVVVENRPLGARSCGSLNRRTGRSISRGRTSPPGQECDAGFAS